MGFEERKQTKEIDGVIYEVTPLKFALGRPALKRLIDIVSPILSAALGAGESDSLQMSKLFDVLPDAFSDDDLSYFASLFGNTSKFQNGDVWVPLVTANQDDHFAQRYLSFFKWLVFCIEVNFSGFFGGATQGGGVADLLKKAMRTAA